jgi:6-pyruvoyl-tetrahydropterin synthase
MAELLESIDGRTKENVVVPRTRIMADFEIEGTFVFVDRDMGDADKRRLVRSGRKCLFVSSSALRSDRKDSGIRIVQLGAEQTEDLQTIFLDDPSFNFDYAHILPHTQKCSVMHGHTSAALVEVIGKPVDGMVVDFGVAKDVIRDALRSLDHKLFINQRYVTREDARSVTLGFRTVHGEFMIQAPKQTTVLLDGEATVENLAREVLTRITPGMPENVTAVGVYVYEGLNKGSHILAQLHQRGEGLRRKP